MILLQSGVFYPMSILISVPLLPLIGGAFFCLISANDPNEFVKFIITTVLLTIAYFALICFVYKISKSTKYYLISSPDHLEICYPNLTKDGQNLVIVCEDVIQFEYYRLSSVKAWLATLDNGLAQSVFMTFVENGTKKIKLIGFLNCSDIKRLAHETGIKIVFR